MSLPNENLDSLLLDYIEGRATPEQSATVRELLKENPALSDEVLGMMLDRQLITSLPKPSAPPELADSILARLERNSLLTNVERDLRDARTHWWKSRLAVAAALLLMFSIFTAIILHGLSTHDNSWTQWADNKPTDNKPAEADQLAQLAQSSLSKTAAPLAANHASTPSEADLKTAALPAPAAPTPPPPPMIAAAAKPADVATTTPASGGASASQPIASAGTTDTGIASAAKSDTFASPADHTLDNATGKSVPLALAFQPASDVESAHLQLTLLAMTTQNQATTRLPAQDAATESSGIRSARQIKGELQVQSKQVADQAMNNESQNYNVQNNALASQKAQVIYPVVIHARLRPSQIATLTSLYHIQPATDAAANGKERKKVETAAKNIASVAGDKAKDRDDVTNDAPADAVVTILAPG